VLLLLLLCISGDRKGGLMCWDLDSGSSSWGVAAAHQGHITALAWSTTAAAAAGGASAPDAGRDDSCCLVSGGQDGVVRVWDGCTGSCVSKQAVHVDKKGKGAVGNIVTGGHFASWAWREQHGHVLCVQLWVRVLLPEQGKSA
jgi:WD40 repeat protein